MKRGRAVTDRRRRPGTCGSGRRLCRECQRLHGEDGQMLPQLLVAFAIFSVIVAMSLVIVAVVTKDSTQTIRSGQAAETAQVAVSEISQYLSNAVPPITAVTSSGGTGHPLYLQSFGASPAPPCWGSSSPAPSGSQISLTSPATLSVVMAHDYDVLFCGYQPGSSTNASAGLTPHLYEIDLQPGSCQNATYGYCTVQVLDYGTNCNPASISTCTGQVADQVHNVWCDAYCQGKAVGGTATAATPPGQTTAVARACIDDPNATSCSGATPPFFEYFGSSGGQSPGQYGVTGTNPTQSFNYLVENTDTAAIPGTSPCSGSGFFIDLYSNSSGSCEDQYSYLGLTQLVTLQISVLSDANTALATPNGQPGTMVNDQVLLSSTLGTSVACSNTAIEGAGFNPTTDASSLIAYWPLDDTSTSSSLIDLAAPTGTSTNYPLAIAGTTTPDVTPGPALCSTGSGGLKLDGSTAYLTPSCPTGNNCGTCPGAYPGCVGWPASGNAAATNFTVEAWFNMSATPTDNPRLVDTAHTDSTPDGFQLMVNNGGTSGCFDVGNGTVNGQTPTGTSCWSKSLSAGTWYFYVGTFNGTTGAVNAYINGVNVESAAFSGGTTMAGGTAPLTIGYNPAYSGDYFNGELADVALYSSTLSAAQIATQYNEMTQ